MTHDVIVIGGSYAGMAAALQLVRARRRVLVIDAGERRNRFSDRAHGFLGQDGADPAELARSSRAQLLAYPTLDWIDGTVTAATRDDAGFVVTTESGNRHGAARLILATGVRDRLPPIPGLAERWGKSVFHCPYCHGFELQGGPIGLIATDPHLLEHAPLFCDWGPVTLLLHGSTPGADALSPLASTGIRLEHRRIAAIEGSATVRFEDGQSEDFAGLFTAPQVMPATPVAESLGCRLEETPMGTRVWRDGMRQSSVAGAFACGDLAHMPHSVSLAVGDGAMTGAIAHRSLVFPPQAA